MRAREHVQVRAGTERAAAAAKQDHPNVVVVGRFLDADRHLIQELPVDGVPDVRPVQPDGGDVTVDFVLDWFCVYGFLDSRHSLKLLSRALFELNSGSVPSLPR